jgi:hypothetical protein
VLEARDTLKAVIAPTLPLRRFITRARIIARRLRVDRRNRPMQLIKFGEILGGC